MGKGRKSGKRVSKTTKKRKKSMGKKPEKVISQTKFHYM